MRYCITHEMPVGEYEIESELEDCIFTSCPPPAEMDVDGWEFTMSLPEPSEEELILMDMNAEVLEADFKGE
jgi:hypothetical protein